MPFQEICLVEERLRFCVMHEAGEVSMSELCRQFGVSRQTGYETLRRWKEGGARALMAGSHAPLRCPHALDEARRLAILEVRQRHPTWGPKKIKAWLEQRRCSTMWPAASTIGELLAREGLSVARKRRRYASPRTQPFAACAEPNDVWSMDFKGWFVTGDGARCDPFTLEDQASRYLIRAVPVERTNTAHVQSILETAFRELGLPKVIRSDNGAPFASLGAGGLSALSVWLIKAGVLPERTDLARPDQNGRLERLHRTMKAETASPPARTLQEQAKRFRSFCKIYNEERPHEALGLVVPASVYVASERQWSGRLREPEYASGLEVRRVRHNGEIKWRGDVTFVSTVLAGEPVGIEETEDGQWRVTYGPVVLGTLSAEGHFERLRAVRRPGRRSRSPQPTNSTKHEKTVNHPPG